MSIYLWLFRVFCEEIFTTEAQSSAEIGEFLTKNSLLGVLRASALKTVADPSFGGSAVQSPSPYAEITLPGLTIRKPEDPIMKTTTQTVETRADLGKYWVIKTGTME
jgi:hypothetical protein